MNMLMCLSKYYSRTVGMPWRRADMMELADMQDLGSCGQPCGFKSHIPHYIVKGKWKQFNFLSNQLTQEAV